MNLGFIGVGAAGGTLALAFARAGVPVVAVSGRRAERAQAVAAQIPGCVAASPQEVVDAADLVFLAVPDDQIEPVCQSLEWRAGVAVVHCSGALSTNVLASACRAGALVGAFHPLCALAGEPPNPNRLAGVTIGIEAEPPLDAELRAHAVRLVTEPLLLRAGDKALYHAAAVLASNDVVTLAALATDLLAGLGLPRERAVEAMVPLLRSAVDNIERVGLPEALTGPIARGDTRTVARHLDALRVHAPEVLPVYRTLAAATVPIAREQGRASPEALRAIERLVRTDEIQVMSGRWAGEDEDDARDDQ